jgi:MFS family permease
MSRQSPRFGGAFESFGHRNYRLLWGGSLLSTTAFMTTFLLVPIVGYEITGSYALSTLAQMGSGLSMFFLGPLGGVIADRYPKKPLVLAGQIFPAILIVITGLMIVTGMITIPLLFLATLLMGFGFALMGPARQAWLGELIPRRLLGNGVALQQMSQNMARVLGPMLGSIAVFFGVSSGALYLAVAGFFLIVVPLTTMLPRTRPAHQQGDQPRRTALGDLIRGFAYLRSNRRLRLLWLYWMVIVVCGFAVNSLTPGIMDREFGRSAQEAFIVFLPFGIASVVISIPLAGLMSGRFAWPLLLIFGLASSVALWAFAIAPTYELLILLALPAGAATSGVMLINMSLMMTNSRAEYFGRVMSFIMLGYGMQSVMAPVWGGLAEWLGGREALIAVAAVALIATAMMAVGWLRTRHLPLEVGTAAADEEPERARSSSRRVRRQPVPAFAARVAPVALMGAQKPPLSSADLPGFGVGDVQ